MTFKEWLKVQETGTGTSAIAVFARPIFSGPIRRADHDDLKLDDDDEEEHRRKKRKKKKKEHDDEELPGLAD